MSDDEELAGDLTRRSTDGTLARDPVAAARMYAVASCELSMPPHGERPAASRGTALLVEAPGCAERLAADGSRIRHCLARRCACIESARAALVAFGTAARDDGGTNG